MKDGIIEQHVDIGCCSSSSARQLCSAKQMFVVCSVGECVRASVRTKPKNYRNLA